MELLRNTLINQHSDINGSRKILQDEAKCRNDCGHRQLYDLFREYADILLPDLMTK